MKVLSIQDISCYGQCSLTVALPILSNYGVETAILPSAILSTHTTGFNNFTFFDFTKQMPKIINHWISENIKFDAIYTGYIGAIKQFEYILYAKEKLLKNNGLFIVDPAMADNGKLYPGLDTKTIECMKQIAIHSDYIIPNITEACLLTNNEYKKEYNEEYIDKLLKDLIKLNIKKIILTGVSYEKGKIGAVYFDGRKKVAYFSNKIITSYHGTGDIFSSIIVGNIMNNVLIEDILKEAVDFIIECILKTNNDPTHTYGVKFEEVLYEHRKSK